MKYEKFDILKKAKYSGRKCKVELPDVDNLFENKREFVKCLNNLYSLYYDKIE